MSRYKICKSDGDLTDYKITAAVERLSNVKVKVRKNVTLWSRSSLQSQRWQPIAVRAVMILKYISDVNIEFFVNLYMEP